MMLQRIRGYLRSDLKTLRWVFLGLYVLMMAGLVGVGPVLDDAGQAFIFLGTILLTQALFVLGSGTMRLYEPMRRRRLIYPIVVASFMFGVLTLGLLLAAAELFDRAVKVEIPPVLALILPVVLWIFWGVVFWNRYRNRPRYGVMASLAKWVLSGSLLELMVCIPSHIVVSRRPGCFVGMATMIGIVLGVCVMCFAFGPALVLLFLRPRFRRELAAARASNIRYCAGCGYDLRASSDRCPECGRQIPVTSSEL